SLKSREKTHWFTFPIGENAKNFSEWERALEFFLERGVTRQSHLIAIGGGAISDVAGFVAATLLRGINWSVVPTTLLAQVDAAIGGKTAINTRFGKILVGSFHEPQKMYACHEILSTLDGSEYLSGQGEVIKYGFLDKKIAEAIEGKKPLEEIIDYCAKYKLEVVKQDINEKGIRKLLNLGHTFGHGIEWHYKMPHGLSVLWGIGIILLLQENSKLIAQWKKLIGALDLGELNPPWGENEFQFEKVLEIMTKDKKSLENESIELIIPHDIGDVRIERFTWHQVREKVQKIKGSINAISLD